MEKSLMKWQRGVDFPEWMTEEALDILQKGYLKEGESPNDMYRRLARTASSYFSDCYDLLGVKYVRELEVAFYNMFTWGWFSPASPVASNFGTSKYMPVSCFLQKPKNTIDGIFNTAHEAAMLSKNGGGLGIDITDLVGDSCVSNWGRLYDVTASIVNQSGVRRGAIAIYCDIEHKDIEQFLHAKELAVGDAREKIYSNIAVSVKDSFMRKVISGDKKAVSRFSSVLRLRMKTGSPYIFFVDNANKDRGEAYEKRDLLITQSNLCNEIMLYTDHEHTANCVLSSLNADKFDEWKGYRFTRAQYTVPELAIFFLDAVQQEFIDKCKVGNKIRPGFEKAYKGAVNGRPVGLGVVGLHSLYQKRGYPFHSSAARGLNRNVFSRIQLDSRRASRTLARLKGEPEWCKGTGMRNTHLMAVAPTTTNSILCNAGSPGIEPCYSNYFVQLGAKGNYIRKNSNLEKYLDSIQKNTPEVWEQIRADDGSVKNLSFLKPEIKEVFRTFEEQDQLAIIEQAADRQAWIDQGQSLNLYIPSDASAEYIWKLHLKAWKTGLKGLYYVRSDSSTKKALQNENMITIHLKTREDCVYCNRAKNLLREYKIPYTEEVKPVGRVPEIIYNGVVLEDGFTSLLQILTGVVEEEKSCTGCEG